jgi:hypothetical protein
MARLLCIALSAFGRAAFGDQSEPLVITMRVRDTAGVPDDVLTKAQGDVTRIYREAGVETVWLTPDLLAAESNAARRAALTVAILSMEQTERIDSATTSYRLGFTARSGAGDGRVAYVMYDRVEMLTGGNGLDSARVLAIAIAHEIGHLLLPFNTHSQTGVMRADWTKADLHLAQRSLTFFTPEQGTLLRRHIAAWRLRPSAEKLPKPHGYGGLSVK